MVQTLIRWCTGKYYEYTDINLWHIYNKKSIILESVVLVSTFPSVNVLLHCCVIVSVAVIFNTTSSIKGNVGRIRATV